MGENDDRRSDPQLTDAGVRAGWEVATISAPFTAEQMQHLFDYQVSGSDPVVCPRDGSELFPTLEPEGWLCQECDFTQDWALAAMAQGQMSGTLAALLDDPLTSHAHHLRVDELT